MLNSLFTFDLDVVLFHIFVGLFQYLTISTLGINFLKLFKESPNPVLVYPLGLFIFSIFVILVWNLNVNTLVVFLILAIFLVYNYKKILDYLNYQIFNKLFLLVLIISFVVSDHTTIHDPDSQNGIQAYGDTYYYISRMFSDLKIYRTGELWMYNTFNTLSQQIGLILGYPFKNFDLFRPILNFSISAWIISMIFVVDILKKNIQVSFVNYQTLVLSFLIFFSLRTNFYIDESPPTILTIPLIFLLSFFLFESFKKDKIILEILLFLVVMFLCLLTKQVLVLLAAPILFFRGFSSKKKIIIFSYSFIILIFLLIFLNIHSDHLGWSLSLVKIKFVIPQLFFDKDFGMQNINRIFQLITLIILLILSYKNIRLLCVVIFSTILFFNTSAGGPYFFWMMLFVIYSIQKYVKGNFLNNKINEYILYFFLFLFFLVSYYLFRNYHFKIGSYFLFFIFLFTALSSSNLKNNLKIIIIILSISFPLSFFSKIPSKINFLINTPLQNGKSFVLLNNKINEIVPKNSIIFTDIAIQNYSENYSISELYKEFRKNPNINYLTQSKRQFYLLSAYLIYDNPRNVKKFKGLVRHNQNIIYKYLDPKKIINNNYYKNFFILVEKEKLENIARHKKNIYTINNYILIEI